MKPNEFTISHRHTLQTDPETRQVYIKLPIADLNELSYMQESLLECTLTLLLSQLEKRQYKNEQMQSIMYLLSKLLLVSYPHAELNGLSEWLKSDAKLNQNNVT
ncbi:hypothetical protein [Flavivirga algicola]|uniref:Uncharacterized protein n=1 Tax=Flavivirga algicola TaxID=2729136 RepID=A0ABX1RZU7_9FLAO|nr:hypothetical protein [Flavivirga algicola]NMH89130.1 hypothetical protein [Flavivirga algicola]